MIDKNHRHIWNHWKTSNKIFTCYFFNFKLFDSSDPKCLLFLWISESATKTCISIANRTKNEKNKTCCFVKNMSRILILFQFLRRIKTHWQENNNYNKIFNFLNTKCFKIQLVISFQYYIYCTNFKSIGSQIKIWKDINDTHL